MGLNYFFFFAGFGVFLPFISPYLLHLGYSKPQIGLIYTSFSVMTLIAPLAGRISDKKLGPAKTLKIFVWGLFASLLVLTFLVPPKGLPFLLALWAYGLLRAPIGSLQDTIAMTQAKENPRTYSRMRVAGSIGFAVFSYAAGHFFSLTSMDYFFPALLAVCLPFLFFSLQLKDVDWVPESHFNTNFWKELTTSWWFWLGAMVLHWLCFAPFHYGFTFLLGEQGVPNTQHGLVWSVGVVAEIFVFYSAGRLFKKWHYRSLLFIAFYANGLRWLILGLAPPPWLVWVTQIAHGAGFALFYTSALQGISLYHGGRFRASYQALFGTSIAVISNLFGISLSGWLHQFMSMSKVFLCFLPFQLLALLLLYKFPLVSFAERQKERFHESALNPSDL